MKKQTHFLERLMDRVDLNEEPLPGQSLLELAGDRRILIENYCGVTEYGRENIQIRVKYGQLCISGHGMIMTQITGTQLVITGCVDCIRIIRGKQS